MEGQNKKQNALYVTWERDDKAEGPTNSDGFSSLRGWQAEAFDELKEASRMILNAPMGSGKSWMMCALAAYKLTQDRSLRCIICVPQMVIAPGFISAKINLPDGTKVVWHIQKNLCAEGIADGGKVRALIEWLKAEHSDLQDRVVLCSHSTLLRTYRKLQKEGALDLLNRLLLWIDEAHHLMNTSSEDLPLIIENNGLGKVIEYLLAQSDRHLLIGLTTASFFRGDRLSLLTDEMKQKFKSYLIPYDKYLASMEHLESFSFDFLLCGHNYLTGIELLLKQRKGKDIIYIPHPNSTHSQGKQREVNSIIDTYRRIHGGEKAREDNSLIILGENTEPFKILDLVDNHPQRRSQRKEFIAHSDMKRNRECLDAIIALNMFKEGADWIWADRCIIVGSRSSLVDIVQMMGRVLRDAKEKKHVEVIQLLPFSLDQSNAALFRDNLNDYLKAIYASLILENILDPVKIKAPQNAESKEIQQQNRESKSTESLSRDWLGIVIPDAAQQNVLLANIGTRLLQARVEDNGPMTSEEHQQIIYKQLEKEGVTEHKEEISWQILGMFARKTMKLQGLSVGSIDFDIVRIGEPLDFLLTYTSGTCNIDTFQKLRDAIQISRAWRPFFGSQRMGARFGTF